MAPNLMPSGYEILLGLLVLGAPIFVAMMTGGVIGRFLPKMEAFGGVLVGIPTGVVSVFVMVWIAKTWFSSEALAVPIGASLAFSVLATAGISLGINMYFTRHDEART